VDLQDDACFPRTGFPKGPAARNLQDGAIPPSVRQGPFPPALPGELGFDFRQGKEKLGLEDGVSNFPKDSLLRPTIHRLGPAVPEGDDSLGPKDDDSVVGQVQEFGLVLQRLLGALALGDVVEIDRDAAAGVGKSPIAKPALHYRVIVLEFYRDSRG